MAPRTISDDNGQSWGGLAQHMSLVTGEMRGLMLESQLARKARLDPHRRDVQFKPDDEVFVDTTHTHLNLFPRQALTSLDGAPSACSPRQLRTPTPSTFPRAGAPSRSSTWNACVATTATLLRWVAMTRSQLQSRASTVNWSMRWRLSSSFSCAPVVHTFPGLYVGPVSMLPVIPGSLWRILLTVRVLFVLLSRLAHRRLRLRMHAAELRLRCPLLGH